MAEKSDVPQSAYAIALELARMVAFAEGKLLSQMKSAENGGANREYVLDLYKDCIKAVASHRLS